MLSGRASATMLCWAACLAGCGEDERIGLAAGDTPPGGLEAGEIEGERINYRDEPACFEIAHDGGASASLRWFWGDSTGPGELAPARTCHTYDEVGYHLVSVTVTARGRSETRSKSIVVVPRPLDPRPTYSAPIAHDDERGNVWVVNPDSGTVAVLGTEPPELLLEIAVGGRPRTVAVSGDVVAVACQESDSVWLLDAATRELLDVVALAPASSPYGVVADPRGGRFWVSSQGRGELVGIDVDQPAVGVESVVSIGRDPRGVAMLGDGGILVTRWRARTDLGAEVVAVDASDAMRPVRGETVLLAPDVGVDSDTNNNGVPSFLNQIVISPSGERAFVPSLKANVVSGAHRTGVSLQAETTARAILSVLQLGSGAPVERAQGRHPFDDLDFASSIALSAEGDLAYVAFQGAERVQILDSFSFNVAGSIDFAGRAPQGIVLGPRGETLWVAAFLSRSVFVFDLERGSGQPPLVAEVSTVEDEPLEGDVLAGKRIFYSSRDPRMSRTSYLACASCHLDGEGDGLVWDFTQRGEGLRNTIPLRGRAGLGHGALHWTANFDEVQDFEHDIRAGQGGLGFLPDEVFHMGTIDSTLGDPKTGLSPELDALAAYVASLDGWGRSPFRRDGDPDWEAGRAAGEALFRSAAARCATCHAGSSYTDSGFRTDGAPVLHDVGTLGPGSGSRLGERLAGLDTPTLRGLYKSAPYLHDGSAPTLRDVLVTRNVGDSHGSTSQLGSAELDDLETFLLSLDDGAP